MPDVMRSNVRMPDDLPSNVCMPDDLPSNVRMPSDLLSEVRMPDDLPSNVRMPDDLPSNVHMPDVMRSNVRMPDDLPSNVCMPDDLPSNVRNDMCSDRTVRYFLSSSKLPRAEIREIIKCVLRVSDAFLLAHADYEIPAVLAEKIAYLEQKRLSGTPLAYVIEERGFYKHTFHTPEGVLIPQPDTEVLVEKAVEAGIKLVSADGSSGSGVNHGFVSGNSGSFTGGSSCSKHSSVQSPSGCEIRILDLCSGTGCIGISAASELSSHFDKIRLTLADIDETALRVSRINAERILGACKNVTTQVVNSDLFSNIKGKFNLILTNPPYIKTAEIPTLESEVQAEPHLALDGGEDGLTLIKKIIENAKSYLKDNAYIFIEIGSAQGEEVKNLLEANLFSDIEIIKDYAGLDRVLKARS